MLKLKTLTLFKVNLGMKNPIALILLIYIWNLKIVTAQNNCAVNIDFPKILCNPDTAIVNINPTSANIFWLNANKEKIDTGTLLKPYIQQNEKFYFIHKLDIGNELIVNGNFEQGNAHFTTDYYVQCSNGYLPQGAYCITPTSTQFYSTWTGCTDFKNPNGNFLVSDGASISNQKNLVSKCNR